MIRRPWLELLIAALSAASCVLVFPMMDAFRPGDTGAMFVYMCFGSIGASVTLLSIWIVLGPRRLAYRWLTAVGVAVVLIGFWYAGLVITTNYRDPIATGDRLVGTAIALLFLPITSAAIQLPLWIAKIILRWNVVSSNPTQRENLWRPMTLHDMLIGSGLFGLYLAMARVGIQTSESTGSQAESTYWLRMGSMLAVCSGVSLLSVVPIVIATLRAQNIRFALVMLGLYAFIAVLVMVTIIAIAENRAPGPESLGIFTMVGTFVLITSAALVCIRQRGYRLTWGRSSIRPISTEGPAHDPV